MFRIAAFTGGHHLPSARFRVRQYVAPLSKLGIDLREQCSRFGSFPPRERWLRPAWGAAEVVSRLPAIVRSHRCDAVLLQRELISTLHILERFTGRPRILDIDDAIWLSARRSALAHLAPGADGIVCGNSFLAEWASQYCRNVTILPTAVDTSRFRPSERRGDGQRVVIGWIGQSSGLKYLDQIRSALVAILARYPSAALRIISDRPPQDDWLRMPQVEYRRWSHATEVEELQAFDIAIMPLDSSEWARGKCSYKMLLSMSCSTSVVVSPVGMNGEVLQFGSFGFGASTTAEWIAALEALIRDPDLRNRLGTEGRRVVERLFSVEVLAPRLARILRSVCGGQLVAQEELA